MGLDTKTSLGYLRDTDDDRYLFHSVNAGKDDSTIMTLETLFDPNKQTENELSRRQRFYISVLLCVSVLQLYSTPWVEEMWNKKRILLRYMEDDGSADSIARNVYMRPKKDFAETEAPDSAKILFSLGVMLLELVFGRRLEDHPKWSSYFGADGKPNDHTAFSTARDWQAKVEGEVGSGYAEAIRKCLLCAFPTRSTSLDDPDLRNAFYTDVLKPVEECWRVGFGIAMA